MLHKSVFLLLNPADIERVLVTDNRNFIKPEWLRTAAVRRLLGDGLVTSEGEGWSMQRHACRPAFESRRMDSYGEAISSIAQRKVANWTTGTTIDIYKEMAHLTMAIVGRLLFLTDPDETDWIAEAGEAVDTLMLRFTAGRSLFGMIPLPPDLTEMKAARRLNGVVDRLIRSHASACPSESPDAANQEDLLSLLKRSNPDAGSRSNQRVLREQVKSFLTAGHESSAIAVSWALLLVAEHPAVEALLQAELQTKLCGRPPSSSDLRELPYMQAILNESLRLYPPIWMTGRQSVSKCEIGGVSIPAGALLMTSQWAVHRLPLLFSRPNDFRPERWLSDETAGLPRCAYFPFGAGPRTCIGLGFAMMESTLLLATIAQRFRLTRTDDRAIQPWATMTLRPPLGIQLAVKSISRGDAEARRGNTFGGGDSGSG
jgi:cytochrome P450